MGLSNRAHCASQNIVYRIMLGCTSIFLQIAKYNAFIDVSGYVGEMREGEYRCACGHHYGQSVGLGHDAARMSCARHLWDSL